MRFQIEPLIYFSLILPFTPVTYANSLWPDFTCVPGWNVSSTAGAKLVTHFDTSKKQFDSEPSCMKSCILQKIGILAKNGKSLATLKDGAKSLAELFSDVDGWDNDLVAEAILVRVQYLDKHSGTMESLKSVDCKDASKWEALFKIVDNILKASCDIFPPGMDILDIQRKSSGNLSELWPLFTCSLLNTTDFNTTTAPSEALQKLIEINEDCQAEFGQLSYLEKKFGKKAVEWCTKACILERMHVIHPANLSVPYLNRTFEIDIPHHTELWFASLGGADKARQDLGKALGADVRRGTFIRRYSMYGSPCWKTDEWNVFGHITYEARWTWTAERCGVNITTGAAELEISKKPFPNLSCLPGTIGYENAPLLSTSKLEPHTWTTVEGMQAVKPVQVLEYAEKTCTYWKEKKNRTQVEEKRCATLCILFGGHGGPIEFITKVENPKDKSVSYKPGSSTTIVKSLRHFIIGRLPPELKKDMLLEAITTRIQFAVKSTMTRLKLANLDCENEGWDTIFEVVQQTINIFCDHRLFPYPLQLIAPPVSWNNIQEDVKRTEKFWPDLLCVPGWSEMQSLIRKQSWKEKEAESLSISEAAKTLYRINHNCREDYLNSPYLDKNFGFKIAGESCTKICILESLNLLSVVDDKNSKEFRSRLEAKFQDSDGNLTELTQILGNDETGRKLGSKLLEVVKVNFKQLHLDREPCYRAMKWVPLLAAVEDALLDNCDSKDEEKGRILDKDAVIDFSCYDDFTIGTDKSSDEVKFSGLTKQCDEFSKKAGLNPDCTFGCLLNKLGIFAWTPGPESMLTLKDSKEMLKSFKKWLSGNTAEETATRMAERVLEKCRKTWNRSLDLGCDDLGHFYDCVEGIFSCSHSRRFLKSNISTQTSARTCPSKQSSKEDVCKEELGKRSVPKTLVDMSLINFSCRESYDISTPTDYTRGVGLMASIELDCDDLLLYGQNSCSEQCVLEQLGVIQPEFKANKGLSRTFVIGGEKAMTSSLGALLGGKDGLEHAKHISVLLRKNCKSLAEKVKTDSCDTEEWKKFAACAAATLNCLPTNIYRNL